MRTLFIHSDFMEYKVKKKTMIAEEITEAEKYGRMDECLVAFITVERSDENKIKEIARKCVDECEALAKRIEVANIMLYPYAHLSSSLSNADTAKEMLKTIEHLLNEEGYNTKKAPFGWYKSFKISCKGHPLSELSREIIAENKITREEVVKKIESEYFVLTPQGKELKIDLKKIAPSLDEYPTLKTFILSEEVKDQPSKEPPSIKAMQRLELVDYEKASDSGHFKFYPRGFLIFSLLKKWSDYIATEKLNALQIDTPILYDWSLPDIREQASSFHQRHYTVSIPQEKKKFVLRFAGDFGLFRMMKNATVSYKHLPLRIYEFSKSFRYEKHGELSGLRRLRAFHMPDLHSFTRDEEQGWKEFSEIYKKLDDLAKGTQIEYAVAFRIVKDFYDKYKDRLIDLLKYSNKPAFIEVLSQKKHYWVVKHEFQGIDSVGGNCQLCTVQLDTEDAKRYGLMYTDEKGKKKHYTICHTSIGSIERWIYSILEDALKKEKPYLPFWLSPTQIRLIPVANEFTKDCEKIANELNARVDIDDRDEHVSRKIRDAEKEWVNMIIVYGEKEKKSGTLPTRLRTGEIEEWSLKKIKEEIEKEMKDYPFERLPLPSALSERFAFR